MERIGFGVIGAGLWGGIHAEIYSSHPHARLVAVCDAQKERAAEVARSYGAPRVFDDYEQLVRDPEVQAVAVVTPDFAHCAPVVAAVQAGKHVLVEKPLATTREEAALIRREVEKAKVRLMVDFHSRWCPPIVLARRDIEGGVLGKMLSAYYRLNDRLFVPTKMLSWAAKSSILWFLGSHAVDTLRYLLADEVERVYAVSRSGVLAARGVKVPDLYQTTLEFRSGVVAQIENNWVIPDSHPMVNDIKVNLLGDRGMINMDLTNNQMMERFLPEASDHPDCMVKPLLHGRHGGFAIESIRDFVDRLARGEEPLVGVEDGFRVTSVVCSIMDSAASRQPVTVRYDEAG